MLKSYASSNPVFSNYFWNRNENGSKMSVSGIFLKSLFCFILIGFSIGYVWNLHEQGTPLKWYTTGGLIIAIISSIIISYKPNLARIFVPVYAIGKGLFLGGASVYAHAKFPNLPFQAVGVTVITFFVMLMLYQLRIINVTKKLRSIIITATISIMVVYILVFVLNLFGFKINFLWSTSWIAIGFNIFAALTASFSLLLDFDYIERYKHKASKNHEWLATWGLLVTLIWLYLEVLRLLRKFAIR